MDAQPMRMQVLIIVEPDGEEFHAYSPSLPGLHTCGATEEEALAHAKDAVYAYIKSMIKHGDPLPIGCARPEHSHWLPRHTIHHHMAEFVFA